MRFVIDGAPQAPFTVAGDPFEAELSVSPAEGETVRVRAEALVGGEVRTLTRHLWVTGTAAATTPDTATDAATPDGGCGCDQSSGGGVAALALALAALGARRLPLRDRLRPTVVVLDE